MLCFHHRKCAKVHKQKPVYLKIYTNFCPQYFKQSDLMDCAMLQASDRSPKKSQILLDFRDQLVEIFSANFAKKQLVKNGQFCGNFLGKYW